MEITELLMRELAGVEQRELHDEYRHALEKPVDAKISGGELVEPPAPQPPVDLITAPEASGQTARRRHDV